MKKTANIWENKVRNNGIIAYRVRLWKTIPSAYLVPVHKIATCALCFQNLWKNAVKLF